MKLVLATKRPRRSFTEPFQMSYSEAKVGGVVSDILMMMNGELEPTYYTHIKRYESNLVNVKYIGITDDGINKTMEDFVI